MLETIGFGFGFVLVFFVTIITFASRYKRCPSDKILVVYGRISGGGTGGLSAKCYHGGAAFIWPVMQDYQFLDLTPMPIDIKLEGALSKQNIRVNTPSTFTVGVSTEPGVMENAAERLLGLEMQDIQELAKDIIFGQMRVVIATMPIEEINADRDKMIENISNGVEVELKKVGLRLINVNIQDITDESGYIDALGKEAAARAINEAKMKVAQQMRDGEIGQANAQREQRVAVAAAHAQAVEGENLAAIKIAQSNADRREKEAEAERLAVAAEKVKSAKALQEAYGAEENAERERAKREQATQYANIVVPAEIEKKRVETLAEAEAERIRRTKKGEADGLFAMMDAEASGLMSILKRKAEGFDHLVRAAGSSAELASLLLITEQLPKLVEEQVKAISNLKIDSITVWEGGKRSDGKTSTADFVSGMVGALPPLHELTKNVGIRLPEFLGTLSGDPEKMEKLGEHLKQRATQSRKTRDAVKDYLIEHLEMLMSFDKNKNLKIDSDELDDAVNTAISWSACAADPNAKWFYHEGGHTVGPVGWSELEKKLKAKPDTFVNLDNAPYWLPFESIRAAR